MADGFIVRRGGKVSETTAAPTITIVTETTEDVTFTLTNNDDNTAFITYEIDDDIAVIELAAAATSSNITVALAAGTYTLTAYATVVGEVASSATVSVEIELPQFELLFDTTGTVTFPQTSFDITGLSVGKNDELRLVYALIGDDSSTAGVYSIRANDITSNYHSQRLSGSGTTIAAAKTTDDRFATARSNRKTTGFADIKVSENSRFVAQSQNAFGVGADSANIENINHNIINTGTVTSITKLTILCNRTNGIASGSRIRLYKVNGEDA
jgi:hypothetical protein